MIQSSTILKNAYFKLYHLNILYKENRRTPLIYKKKNFEVKLILKSLKKFGFQIPIFRYECLMRARRKNLSSGF